jgi:hypothetical protein
VYNVLKALNICVDGPKKEIIWKGFSVPSVPSLYEPAATLSL